jgi:DNA-binding NarL/FixJ family response regulator
MEKQKRVFLYESLEIGQRSTERYINSIGIPAKVEHTNNHLKAKEIAKTENFDLVIVDVVYPGLKGLKVAEAFRMNNPTVKIMITSPYHINWLVQICFNLKFNAFFIKEGEMTEYKNCFLALLNGNDYIPDVYKKDFEQTDYPEESNFYRLPNELKQIYALLVRGHDCEFISKKISLGLELVKNQRNIIYKMAKVQTPAELIIYNYTIQFNKFMVFEDHFNFSKPSSK